MPEAQAEAKKRKLVKGRHRAAIKRQRQNRKRARRNRRALSAIPPAVKKLKAAILKKDRTTAQELLRQATSLFHKAARKRMVHARNASRHIARLSSLVQSL